MTILNDSVKEIEGYKVIQDYQEMADAVHTHMESVYHWEGGNSLYPLIRHMEYCFVQPLMDSSDINVGDIVLCSIKDGDGNEHYMIHMVTAISKSGYNRKKWYQIGTTDGYIFGWSDNIIGIAHGTNIFHKELPIFGIG